MPEKPRSLEIALKETDSYYLGDNSIKNTSNNFDPAAIPLPHHLSGYSNVAVGSNQPYLPPINDNSEHVGASTFVNKEHRAGYNRPEIDLCDLDASEANIDTYQCFGTPQRRLRLI